MKLVNNHDSEDTSQTVPWHATRPISNYNQTYRFTLLGENMITLYHAFKRLSKGAARSDAYFWSWIIVARTFVGGRPGDR